MKEKTKKKNVGFSIDVKQLNNERRNSVDIKLASVDKTAETESKGNNLNFNCANIYPILS